MKKRPLRDRTNEGGPAPRSDIASRGGGRARVRTLVAVVVVASVAAGCAYFNTFYNARAHFKKAERLAGAQRESRRDGVNLATTRGAASSSASREYDLTIEKCNKVIHNHSGSRWVDDAILLMGRAYLGKHQYRDALNKFETLVNDFPDSDLRTEAIYFQGVTYYKLGRDEEGRQTFEMLLENHPKFERRDEILVTQAESFIEAGDVDRGTAVYRRVLREFDDRDRRVETLLRLGELYMNEGAFDSAYAAYEEVAGSAERMTVRLDARERRADALAREGRNEDALAGYLEVLDLGTDLPSDRVGPLKLKAAAARVQLGNVDDALSEYEQVREAYPNTPHAAEATFEIGRIHELYVGDYGRAIEMYDELNQIRGAATQSLFVTQGRARAEKLRRLVELGVTGGDVSAKSGTEAEAMFLLAEQFLFQEADTIRSWVKYKEVATEYPDSPFGPLARYGLAWIALRRDADAESTEARLVDVLLAYPGTPQAIQVGDILAARGSADLIPEGALDTTVDSTATPGTTRSDSTAAVSTVPRDSTVTVIAAPGDSTMAVIAAPDDSTVAVIATPVDSTAALDMMAEPFASPRGKRMRRLPGLPKSEVAGEAPEDD